MSSDAAIDRFIYYHPHLADQLDIIEPGKTRDKISKLLQETAEFLSRHELRPSADKSVSIESRATHTVYGGSVRTWFSSISGKFRFDTCEAVSRLNFLSGQLFRSGCPLFLVECRQPDLQTFPLYLDIDIAVADAENSDVKNVEKELLGSDETGFPLMSYIVRILHSVYSGDDDVCELLVSSATGGKKISWRLVFPNIVVNAERLGILRDYIVQKLNHLSSRRDEKILNNFKDRLIALSPGNMFRTIIDESAAKSRHGIRMVFNDKVSSEGKLENRPFHPLIHIVSKFDEESKKFKSLISTEFIASPGSDMEWARKNSLLWPSLTHRSLTEWTQQPAVRSSANIRTGPGGSSLCLSSMTVGDAVRAASRFEARRDSNKRENFSEIFKWEEGSVASFKKRLPIGLAGKFVDQTSKSTWILQSEPSAEKLQSRSSVSFDETTCVLTVLSMDANEFKYLTRMIARRFPNVQPAAPQIATIGVANNSCVPEDKREPKIYAVLKTYRGEEPGELDVDEGEHVELVNHDPSGWSAVKSTKSGKIGYVPATFIRQL